MDWAPLGKVTKTHGLKGELKFYPFIADHDLCRKGRCIRLGEEAPRQEEYWVESFRGGVASRIIKFKGCDTIEAAETLRGSTVFAPRDDFKKLPEGEYYWFDIQGLQVYDEQGRFYGNVTEIIETGSNDVYVVKKGGKELLLPAIEWVIKTVDLKQKKLTFRIVEGLLEENAV